MMTVWVFENGTMVVKGSDRQSVTPARSDFPLPMVSHMEPYESPIEEGKTISSWRQRDAEMREHDCYDPRDVKKKVRAHGRE